VVNSFLGCGLPRCELGVLLFKALKFDRMTGFTGWNKEAASETAGWEN
jgi:hypothetical protein